MGLLWDYYGLCEVLVDGRRDGGVEDAAECVSFYGYIYIILKQDH